MLLDTSVTFAKYVAASWAGMLPNSALVVLTGATVGPEGRSLSPWAWTALLTCTISLTLLIAYLARRAVITQLAELARLDAESLTP